MTTKKIVKPKGEPRSKPVCKGRKRGVLTDKEARFCEEYIIDQNGTKAAIRAGYSPKSANQNSTNLLARPLVAQKVRQLLSEMAQTSMVTAQMIAQEYKKIAFSNIDDVLVEGNEVADIKTLPKEVSAAVEAIKKTVNENKEGKTTSVQVKMHSKLAALEALAKHLGFFENDNRQKKLTFNVGFDE